MRPRYWGRRLVPPRSPAGLSTQPAHRRERPRLGPAGRVRRRSKGRSRLCAAGEMMSPAGSAKPIAFQSGCALRKCDECALILNVQNAYMIAYMTWCRSHTWRAAQRSPCLRAPRRSPHTSCRGTSCAPAYTARGPGGVAPASNSARPLGRVKGALRRSLVPFVAPLTRPARSQLRWLLPERRRSSSLHLDLSAEFDHEPRW